MTVLSKLESCNLQIRDNPMHQSPIFQHNQTTLNYNQKFCSNLDIAWCPPNESWIKVNCDDSMVDYGLKAACGGVISTSNGNFVVGFFFFQS